MNELDTEEDLLARVQKMYPSLSPEQIKEAFARVDELMPILRKTVR
jgi:hypothetical protein